ncbi:RNA-guided endonuclease InsQ/TnpB family protein [Sporosarcina ureilytica]|uniref:Transposase n=1 Tax=Sporosarcina ureilytica TaxID=298596 RepID=A0A1D8JED8_9BACL|nr:RNA-guided endonuclease TnpB family protein [Sporosarcina ureilytica]AOV07043.1 transposase [Sporosarcina ureilytica]
MIRKTKRKWLRKKAKNKDNIQHFTQVQHLGGRSLSAKAFRTLNRMTHSTKALRNVALYTWKQYYKENGTAPSTKIIDTAMKKDMNYWGASANAVQAIRRTLLSEIKSFFEAMKDWKINPDKYKNCPKFPNYSKSTTKRIIELYEPGKIDEDGFWTVPMNKDFKAKFGEVNIKMPANLRHQKVTYIEIVPKHNGRFFEVHYTYEIQKPQMKKAPTTTKKALSIDIGVNNLMACATNTGETFLIDGLKLKSINQYFNKALSRQQESNLENGLSKRIVSKKQAALWTKRARQIKGYFTQAIGLLFKKAKALNVDTIIVGINKGWKQKSAMGKKHNQQFVSIPFKQLLSAIENKCLKEGIRFIEQEESYTSVASFLDRDKLPVYGEKNSAVHVFTGKRMTRGLYRSSMGTCLNADINAALNILRKTEVISLDENLKPMIPKRIAVQQRKSVA